MPAARHGRRARLRGHARALPRRPRRPRLPRAIHRCARTSSRRICDAATPEWASAITGLSVEEIEAFAALVGTTQAHAISASATASRRQRNGAVNMHAALCIAAVTGAWQYEGGGAFHNNSAIFHCDKTPDRRRRRPRSEDPRARPIADRRRSSCGDAEALQGGPPVKAMLVQNTNPASVAPEQEQGEAGLRARGPVRRACTSSS